MNEVLATLATDEARLAGAPERPRQRVAVVERRVPDLGARRRHRRAASTTSSPRSSTSPISLEKKADAVGGRRQVRPHPPHGCDARSPSARSSAATPARSASASSACRRRSPASPRCRSAAPRSAPASTRPPASRRRSSRSLADDTGLPITEALDHFEAQGARDGARRGIRRPARARRLAHQDLQRPALDGLRPEHRPRRAAHPRPAARLVDHARQGQPGDPRGRHHGRRARDRQRRDDRLGRRHRQLRAQRRDPGHGHRAARVDPPARELDPRCSPTRPSTASRPTSSAPARSPSRRRRS